MPHLRVRHCLNICLKKLKFAPVLAIQGMRQTGKSIFVRELLKARISKLQYVTLDSPSERIFANSNPESFLAKQLSHKLIAIDEAQKAPDLFDAIKMVVDKNRKPGMFILLGSTEFSRMTMIRESLTGRMSRLRIYPLNFSEAFQLKPNISKSLIFANEKSRFSRTELLHYLNRGGMPGIFATRDESERISLIEDWLSLTLERDLKQIPKASLDTDLALHLLRALATVNEPTAGNLAKQIGTTLLKVKVHLEALCTLFVIQKLIPYPGGRGKTLYFLGDVSFATYFNASFERKLQTWVLQEILSQISYRGEVGTSVYFYRGSRGGIIDLIIERRNSKCALKLLSTEAVDERELQGLFALKEKHPSMHLFVLGGIRAKIEDVEIFPCEAIG